MVVFLKKSNYVGVLSAVCRCIHIILCICLFVNVQCITLTLEDEFQASTTAPMPLALASLPCIFLMTAREVLSISKSPLLHTQPTNTQIFSTQMTPLLHMKPPSTQTASSTWTSVGTDPVILAFQNALGVEPLSSFSFLCCHLQDTEGFPWCRARWTPWETGCRPIFPTAPVLCQSQRRPLRRGRTP